MLYAAINYKNVILLHTIVLRFDTVTRTNIQTAITALNDDSQIDNQNQTSRRHLHLLIGPTLGSIISFCYG